MNCVRPAQKYENHLTYPMVVNHRIMEVEGRIINSWADDTHKLVSVGEWNQLMCRLQTLEKELEKYRACSHQHRS